MSFDWYNYLTLAKSLKCSADARTIDEASCRASISRAYYAVYGLSCNYLCNIEKDQHLEWAVKLGNKEIRDMLLDEYKSFHSYVIQKFKEPDSFDREDIKEIKLEIAEELITLKRRRKKADYDDRIRNVLSETEAAIDSAEKIVEHLKYLKKNYYA